MIEQQNLLFLIALACDLYAHGHDLFHEVAKCPTVLLGAGAILDHIRASGDTSPINGYIIHSHQYQSSKPSYSFWSIQASIVDNLLTI
jgi:hypothetical protein